MTDKEILQLFEKDERSGFEALVREYSGYITVIASSRLGGVCDRDRQRDAVSDIFIEILASLRKRGAEIRSLKAFISAAAVRHCADLYRRYVKESGTVLAEEIPEQGVKDTAFDRVELMSLLKALGEPDCEIFLRRYYLGQKSAEIGKALGLEANTVDQRISRGLKKLREQMKE